MAILAAADAADDAETADASPRGDIAAANAASLVVISSTTTKLLLPPLLLPPPPLIGVVVLDPPPPPIGDFMELDPPPPPVPPPPPTLRMNLGLYLSVVGPLVVGVEEEVTLLLLLDHQLCHH